MTNRLSGAPSRTRRDKTDALLRVLIIGLVAAVIGATALLGYTIWQSRKTETTATPAQRALQGLAKLVKDNPNSSAARVRYGEALASAGLDEQAVEQLEYAVKLDPNHSGALLDLGLLAMRSDERAAAEAYFNKVLKATGSGDYQNINQRREQAYFHLGEIALDDRRFEEAAGYFKAALRIRKDSSDSYYLLAQALRGMGKDDGAVDQLEAALAFDPNYPEAHYLYGLILLERGDKVNAAVHLVAASELAPAVKEPKEALKRLGSAEDAYAAAEALFLAKDYTPAVDAVLLSRTLDDKRVESVILHARILLAMGSDKAAAQVLAEAEKLDPDNAQVIQLKKQVRR